MRAETLARLHLSATVLVAMLAAGTATAGGGADSAPREVRTGYRAGETERLVVCVGLRPADGSALTQALRRGLFDVCESYRTGTISADEYRATLEAYPALVLQTAALAALERPDRAGTSEPQAAALRQQLAANPALPVLCRTSFATASPARPKPWDPAQVCTLFQ